MHLWTYSFVVWPDESRLDIPKSLFTLFEMTKVMVDDEFTEEQFAKFRSELAGFGVLLREISRRSFVASERVP